MKKNTLLPLIFWCFATILLAQNEENKIFTDCGYDLLLRQYPELKINQTRIDQALYQFERQHHFTPLADQKILRALPVVVHIIHNGGPENISDAQVLQGIAQLNAAFDASFGTGVNADIQFCLAQRDPQGQTTSGITRNQSALTSFDLETQDLAVKDLNRWAPTCFINIWVVSAINSTSSGNGVVGYAYLPSAHGLNVDGIVMEASYFGSSQANTGVLVHEMGHYLGLYHTFEGGCANNNCLLDGDHVCDTPPDQTIFSSCNPNANSCGTDANDPSVNNPFTIDMPDLGEDYMDYSTLACFSKFTQGQSDRMNWHITHVRNSLLGCLSCQTPCPAPLTATITLPAAPQTITVGNSLNFSGSATNASNFAWNIDANPAFDNAQATSYSFNNVGIFWVKFRAISSDPVHCADVVDSVQVTVNCDAQAIFSIPAVVMSGMATTFTNNSISATTYEWLLDNIVVSTSANLTYTFNNSGVYQLCLNVSNNNCSSALCSTVYVQNNGGPTVGCDNTFIQSLANMGGNRPNIFPHPNGDFFATGLRNDSIVIVRFDQGGTALWARAFRFGASVLQIRDMFVDASGDLIGVASPEALTLSELRTTAFRYNMTSGTFVWIKFLDGVLYTQIHAFNSDKLILTGESDASATQLTQLNKNTGAINGYNLEGEAGDFYSTLHNGTLYGTCRRYYNASGDFRTSVFAHNANTGAFQWQNAIISKGNTSGSNSTRMYPEKPIIDNDRLLVIASGDLDGFGTYLSGPVDLVVASNTLTGTVVWTKQYAINGNTRPAASAIVATMTGYYVVCNLYNGSFGNFNFGALIKTDKQGNVLWAKRLGISGKNIVRNVMERNGFIYLTMSSDSYAPDDLLLVKLDQDGNTNTDCDFVQPITVVVSTLTNIQEVRNYGVSNSGPTPVTVASIARPTNLQTVIYCNTPCVCPELPISAGNDTTICLGESVPLSATPGFDSYQWNQASSLDNPAIPNPIATPGTTTTYVVTATKFGVEMINNGDFSQGNTGFTSSYIFNGAGYGHYYLSNNPTQVHNLWSIPNDHSPTTDNMVLLVDGDNSGTFPHFWQQSVIVQPNTNYVFQFWGAMAYPASAPKIQVKINGVVQTTFNMQDGAPVWQHFALNINSGASTQLNIELIDLNTAGFGNDFGIDDISLQTLCYYTDSVTVSVKTNTGQILDLGADISTCNNAVHTFDAGPGFENYLWQDGSTNRSYTAFTAGTYWVTVRDSCGSVQQDTVRIILTPTPTLDLGADQWICLGDSVQLNYTSNGTFSSFNWSPAIGLGCTLCPIVWASPLTTTWYFLAATTADGCTNADSILVVVPQPSTSVQTITQCGSNPFEFNGHIYTQTGVYLDTLTAVSGCDSIVTTQLSFLPLPTTTTTISFCQGETVSIGGNTYSQSGTVIDTLVGVAGCDTIATYILISIAPSTRTETITFCPGETVTIGGMNYTQPGIVIDTLNAPGVCDTIVTYMLQFQPDVPSNVSITCPPNLGFAVQAGGGNLVVNYTLPTASTDCPCPGIALTLTAGLPTGAIFASGMTTVCYTAEDSCGNSAACCFQVFIREELACDIKENGCMKYELLNITADAGQNFTYRIRVTNRCANKLIYTAIQIPDGVTALEPSDMSLFEALSGREYQVRNPNYAPFYSIRFKSTTDSIANGQSEIFQYTLPAQAVPTYIDITSRLVTQEFYEAHLNTFFCPIGITPDDDRPGERDFGPRAQQMELRLFPNPNAGELLVDLADLAGKKVALRVLNLYGQTILQSNTVASEAPYNLMLPAHLANGLYLLEVYTNDDIKHTARFVLNR